VWTWKATSQPPGNQQGDHPHRSHRHDELKANTLAEALVEARQIADYEVGAVEIRYVNDGGTVPMRTVLASRKAVAEHAAWLKARRG